MFLRIKLEVYKTVKILVIKYKYEYEINVLKIWQVSAFTIEP